MRLKISNSKNSSSFYVIKDFTTKNNKRSTKIVEKLGNLKQVTIKARGQDPYQWAKEYVAKLNKTLKLENPIIQINKNSGKQISKNNQITFNGGYLFLDKIYHELKLNKICDNISKKYKFEFDLNSILSRLLYGRIIFPSSKLATYELSKKFIEQPNFELHQIYRALEIIANEKNFIQSEVYKNSLEISNRNSAILYYDCTNYFFEIEQEEGLKQYCKSKENRPNPAVQMGLFMDGDGIPLSFNITPGNTNEQTTMTPLEQKILDDFKLSKFIVCTDAGLASNANRKFNDKQDRAFITTQSIKKLKKFLMNWALSPEDWHLNNDKNTYNINDLEKSDDNIEKYKDYIFYKERWINENGLEQKLIVTYSIKYKEYQRQIRNSQIERAKNVIKNSSIKLNKFNQNDYKRFVNKTNITSDGEIAEIATYSINNQLIEKEERFDGFYSVCTNLDDDVSAIIKINKRRWEIEESFRIMKSEFKARPVYLKRDDRITAHFTTCFLALVLHRFLEKRLNEKFTSPQIIQTLRNMNFLEVAGDGYIPTYTRTDLTDDLHEKFNFRTDYEINTIKNIKKILKEVKI
ncbi:MAG: IS1634 family transposase [Clostridia bacterium]|nr:IS1634 family transposase [Clostridia bacterium]MDD4408887.1 IS1634 family transposase [Clostridia bacterium]